MKETKVVHCMIDEYDVYVGRGYGKKGKWGNPFSHKEGTMAKYKVDTVEEAVEKYKEYILNNSELLGSLKDLKNKTLACWCAPKDGLTTDDRPFVCHGQVLLELLEELDKSGASDKKY